MPGSGCVETSHVTLVRSEYFVDPYASRSTGRCSFLASGNKIQKLQCFRHYVGDALVAGLGKISLKAWLVAIDEGWLTLFVALARISCGVFGPSLC